MQPDGEMNGQRRLSDLFLGIRCRDDHSLFIPATRLASKRARIHVCLHARMQFATFDRNRLLVYRNAKNERGGSMAVRGMYETVKQAFQDIVAPQLAELKGDMRRLDEKVDA